MVCGGGRGLFEQEGGGGGGVVPSVGGPLLAVFLRELLGVLHELGSVFAVLLRQVGPERVLRLGAVHQGDEVGDHWRRGAGGEGGVLK